MPLAIPLLTFLLAQVAAPTPPVASSAAGQIRGTISYGRHEPAVGAIVVVRPESGVSPVRAATTGTSGSFAFNGLPDGTYRAEVRREGYAPVVKTGIGVRAPFRAVVEVQLARGDAPAAPPKELSGNAALSGTIRGSAGAPLSEAHVRLTRVGGDEDSRSLLTDTTGTFTFPALSAGRWRFEVQGAGLLPLRTDLDLEGDVSVDAQLAAQPANYKPLPQDLLVPEDVIPPPGT
jgi:hypothetical protein